MGYCILKSGVHSSYNRGLCESSGGVFYTDSEYEARGEQLKRMNTLDKEADAYQYGTGSLAEKEKANALKKIKDGEWKKFWFKQPRNTGEYDPTKGSLGWLSRDSLGSLPFVGGVFGGGEVNAPKGMPFGDKFNQGSRIRPIQHTTNTKELYAEHLKKARNQLYPDGLPPEKTYDTLSNKEKSKIRNLTARFAQEVGLPDGSGDIQGQSGGVFYDGYRDSKGFKHVSGVPEIMYPIDLTTPSKDLTTSSSAQADLKKAMNVQAALNVQNEKPIKNKIKTKPKEMEWYDKLMSATPGGAGGWDNPLYRMGELIREMDAPGSWGLDGKASERWSDIAIADAKNKALTGKNAMAAQAKIDEKEIDRLLSYAKTNPSHLAKAVAEYLPEELNERWFGRDFTTEEKQSLSHQIALAASDAMFQASLDGQFIPISVALKLAAQQLVKEKKKKENNK